MSARVTIQAFVESMTSLMAILEHELELLRERKFDAITKLQQRKTHLVRNYGESQSAIEDNPGMLDALDTQERGDLRELYARFREVLADNMVALKAAHNATDRVINLVIDSVRKSRGINSPEAAAQSTGRPRGYGAYMQASAAPFAVNQEL